MKNSKLFRNRCIFAFDVLGIAFMYLLSVAFISGGWSGSVFMHNPYVPILIAVAFYSVVFAVTGIYMTLWQFAGTKDYIKLIISSVFAGAALFVALLLTDKVIESTVFSFRHTTLWCVFNIAYMAFVRMLVRALAKIPEHTTETVNYNSVKAEKVLIVGAGAAATLLIKDMNTNNNLNFDIVGLVDDNPDKYHSIINGYHVIGNRNDIPHICIEQEIDQIFLAIPSASVSDKKEIVEICSETKATLKTVPSVDQIIESTDGKIPVRNVQIEDLLERSPIKLSNSEISEYIENKVVLVTGGGGSIGSELCRQIMKYKPQRLVIVDIYENNAYDLQMELNRKYPDNKPTVLIASVRDKRRLDDIFRKYRPYIVFHAAAHKHVPLMEVSPSEAIKNNVFGTLNVAMCADEFNVKRFVMISTDKAVNPTNIMGATKRMCEMIVQSMQKISNTEFVAVRFGNVLGSNGSVIPLFKRQIEEGGPVTVTHKDITRYFMTIPEAAQLVLQAASYAKGGEIFVLDMGKPVKIYDLAKNLIRLSGYTPGVDIKIEVTGLRPGEKLYEELLMNEEGLKKTQHSKIFIGSPIDISMEQLKPDLDLLSEAAEYNDAEKIKDIIERVVPTYIREAETVNHVKTGEKVL